MTLLRGRDARNKLTVRDALAQVRETLSRSFNPSDVIEAQIVENQLDMVRSSLRLFDLTLPVAGAVFAFFHLVPNPAAVQAWWAALILNCAANEIYFSRPRTSSGDAIADARSRARGMAAVLFVLTLVWGSIVLWLWNPSFHANQMFSELILTGTLAALTTLAARHAASAAAPVVILSFAIVALPAASDLLFKQTTIGMALIYVILMVGQAWSTHLQTWRMLRLEHERADLIAHLRLAKAESDFAHESAVAASKAKSEFLANMSHELRTPLNAIIGFSDIVRTKAFGDSADKYSEYGSFIHQSGNRLLDLIDDILDLAKMEAGRKVLVREPVDIAGLVSDALEREAKAAAAKGLDLVKTLPQELPLIEADVKAVRQILANLISNAIKFTPPGGRIEVKAMINGKDEMELTVADTGIGIAPEDQTHLFDRFGRGRPDVTAAHRGSGLGLPIVKGLVDMHGGRIEVASAIGEGTSIVIAFPAKSTLRRNGRRVA